MGANCDFVQSLELKRLQAVELDIFKEFRRLCNKYNIRYYAEGGTLLGAVRHNGFIPWDDDVDIQMTWDEFIKFKEVAAELKDPYVFQDYTTNDYYDISPMARIRNTNTTGCTKWELDNVNDATYNRGIFIDIWVLFPIPSKDEDKVELKSKLFDLWKSIRGWYAYQSHKMGKSSSYDNYIPYWERLNNKYTIYCIFI